MTEGEFPFRSFTMRSEGYDGSEVDSYVSELQNEIVELRRALETATPSDHGDARLHDPEGAVTRTLAIAQETADRVLHDAQVEADRRRVEADEHASSVVAEADERAARLLGDMEAQAAEVREQGVAAARSAIQVERDKAMAELAHVRRVRDDLRTEAVDLKAALDRYRSQAREASDTLAAASSGPLMSFDLPDFIDDDVVPAGISSGPDEDVDADGSADLEVTEAAETSGDVDEEFGVAWADADTEISQDQPDAPAYDSGEELTVDQVIADDENVGLANEEPSYLRAVDDYDAQSDATEAASSELKSEIVTDTDESEVADGTDAVDDSLAEVIEIDGEPSDGLGGTFLSEVRAAAEDDEDVALAPENETSDRFLSELRGLKTDDGDELDSDAADTFFDN